MTIILSALLPDVVIQASDRLVTYRENYREHDRTANKSVVYVGADCRLLIGYTGDAYVGNVPTDVWIVEQLHGWRLNTAIEFSDPPRALHARAVLERLASRVPRGITMLVGGYQMTRRGERPRQWLVSRGSITRLDNPQAQMLMQANLIPPGWETREDAEAFMNEIRSVDALEYPNVMARAVRRIAERSAGVGEDIMVALLLKDQRYMEVGLQLGPVAPNTTAVLYSPAAIFPGTAIPPSRLGGEQSRMIVGPGYIEVPATRMERGGEHMLVLNPNHPLGPLTAVLEQPRRRRP